MIIVSNASPLTNLAIIGEFELLKFLFGEIHIPEAVWDELHAEDKNWPGSLEVASAEWIHRHAIGNPLSASALQRDIDRGEAEAIVLAMEIQADVVLMDEKQGRHAAARWGLKPLGVVGILLEAKKRGLLENVRPRLDFLREMAGFWIHERLYKYALDLAGEMDDAPKP